jgi:hypothetical protein
MARSKTGELLFHLYRKRVSSFLMHLKKSGRNYDAGHIHKTRVDAKKINAFYKFLEMISAGDFTRKKHSVVYRHLFRQTGRVRELQLNIAYLEAHFPGEDHCFAFKEYLRYHEEKEKVRFLSSLIIFNEKDLKAKHVNIKEIVKNITGKNVYAHADKFMIHEARIIKSLVEDPEDLRNIHTIRRHLKTIAAIADLLHQVRKTSRWKRVLPLLNHTEILIGNWHDRTVFLGNLEKFYRHNKPAGKKERADLEALKTMLTDECDTLLFELIPEIHNVLVLLIPLKPARIRLKPAG